MPSIQWLMLRGWVTIGNGMKAMRFAAFAGQKYLNLETFKRSGQGVKTPVWFAAEPSANLDSNDAKLYVCQRSFRTDPVARI